MCVCVSVCVLVCVVVCVVGVVDRLVFLIFIHVFDIYSTEATHLLQRFKCLRHCIA